MFHPFSQKTFSLLNTIPLSVPPVWPDSLFPSKWNPRQYFTRLARKSFPVKMQSSSMFHPFSQKIFARQNAILVNVPPVNRNIFSSQNAILINVPPVWPENFFQSKCNTHQCSTRLTRKSFPVKMQSLSMFHPFSQKIFARQNAILVNVPSV